MRQLVVASEYGEPSRHQEIICSRLRQRKDACLLLITKELPLCEKIVSEARRYDIPIQIHCTITGLGGTSWEPHMHAPSLIVESCLRLLENYQIDPKAVTLRIDPIINEALGIQFSEAMITIKAFSEAGIKDCRVSVLDYYPHVRVRMSHYKFDVEPCHTFQIPEPRKSELISFFYRECQRHGMRLHLCAERVPDCLLKEKDCTADTEGCASKESWERLGITDLKPAVRRQRRDCTCNLSKIDLLQGLSKGCKGGCIYCYWRS